MWHKFTRGACFKFLSLSPFPGAMLLLAFAKDLALDCSIFGTKHYVGFECSVASRYHWDTEKGL